MFKANPITVPKARPIIRIITTIIIRPMPITTGLTRSTGLIAGAAIGTGTGAEAGTVIRVTGATAFVHGTETHASVMVAARFGMATMAWDGTATRRSGKVTMHIGMAKPAC